LALTTRTLTAVEFEHLAVVPPELEWFANIRNIRTRRAYHNDVTDFVALPGSVHLKVCAPSHGRMSSRGVGIWKSATWRPPASGANWPPSPRSLIISVRKTPLPIILCRVCNGQN